MLFLFLLLFVLGLQFLGFSIRIKLFNTILEFLESLSLESTLMNERFNIVCTEISIFVTHLELIMLGLLGKRLKGSLGINHIHELLSR
jgi:hypothetical protein